MTKNQFYLVTGLCLSYALVAQAADVKPGSAAQAVLVRSANGEWRLEARQADLPKLIAEIAAKTATEVHYTVLPDEPVDATCIGVGAAELLQCLLGSGVNMAFRQAESGHGGEIWIMGSSLAKEKTAGGACRAAAPLPAAVDAVKPDMTEQWLRQSAAKDPAQRAQAIAELANADSAFDARVRATLQKALSDKDALVRAQAIGAWAIREGEAGAGEQLRQALSDRDADVRVTALEHVEQDEALLQLATQDTEPAVRAMAEAKLEQLSKQ